MNNIQVDIRLRPIRFGFLVRPDDAENILEIFRINTCLWGGMFNPIIPFFESVPTWWERGGYRFEDEKQIINGYLNFFEPDFLIEAEEGISNGFGYDPKRVIQFADVLAQPNEVGSDKYGLSVHELYTELYEKEFRFELRQKYNFVDVETASLTFENFVAANFGSFPTQEQFGYFQRNYQKIFNPKLITLDPEKLLELYKSRYASPLGIGREKLRVDYHSRRDPTLFILDVEQSKDLVDFWNLRGIAKNVIPIPVQWIEELSPSCKEFILKNYRSIDGNSDERVNRTALIFARSIAENDIQEIDHNFLSVDEKQASSPQEYYPPIWQKPSEKVMSPRRPTLHADSKKIELQVNEDNPQIQFEPIFPDFISEFGNDFRIANVVKLQDWSNKNQIATIFPCNYRNPSFPKFTMFQSSGSSHLPTTEGLVSFPKYKKLSQRWNLVDGTTAINNWLKDNQVSTQLSDSGRATQQIIQTLEGFGGVGCIAYKGIIDLLNKMANKPLTKTCRFEKFKEKIDCAIDNQMWAKRTFETLVERKAAELGLEIKCSKCGSRSWYSMTQLDYSLICNLCLKQFNFPVTNPEDNRQSRWAYRVIGPFALPDYARGGYAAALAIRFFAGILGDPGRSVITWSAGQELELPSGKKVEADLLIWHQRTQMFGQDHPTDMVFGEAKSFAKSAFKKDDVNKMKLLAETFPGSILVFATMREAKDITKGEINRIKELAEWGREYDKERQQTRAPVIVLTETELFSDYSLRVSWKEKGGRHKMLIEPGWARTDNLRVLADLTQQLYLGMPSYGTYLTKQIRKQNQLQETASTQTES